LNSATPSGIYPLRPPPIDAIWYAFFNRIDYKKTKCYLERDEEKRAEYESAISGYKNEEIVYVNESGIDRSKSQIDKGGEGVWLRGWEKVSAGKCRCRVHKR
jgi:hypothetical protein